MTWLNWSATPDGISINPGQSRATDDALSQFGDEFSLFEDIPSVFSAEGIEEKELFDLLQKMGCDYGQGFLFSPTVPPETFAQMIKNNALLL